MENVHTRWYRADILGWAGSATCDTRHYNSKLVAGKTPTDMTSLNYDGPVKETVTDPNKLLQVNGFMSISSIIVNGLAGALQVFDDAASALPIMQSAAVQQPHPKAVLAHLQKYQSRIPSEWQSNPTT